MYCTSWFHFYALAYACTHTSTDRSSHPSLLWWGWWWVERSEAELHVVGWCTFMSFMSHNPSLRLHLLHVCGRLGRRRILQHEHYNRSNSVLICFAFCLNPLFHHHHHHPRVSFLCLTCWYGHPRSLNFSFLLTATPLLLFTCHSWSSTITLPSPSSHHHPQPDKPA